MAWFAAYLGPRIGAEAALAAVTAYQNDMLPAILPMYVPMLLVFGIHFVMLLAGKTRYPTMYANSEDFQVLAITTMVSSFVAEWNDQNMKLHHKKGAT